MDKENPMTIYSANLIWDSSYLVLEVNEGFEYYSLEEGKKNWVLKQEIKDMKEGKEADELLEEKKKNHEEGKFQNKEKKKRNKEREEKRAKQEELRAQKTEKGEEFVEEYIDGDSYIDEALDGEFNPEDDNSLFETSTTF